MKWPLSQDFNEAVQNPRVVFRDADLRTGEAVVGARGLPLPRSGNFADVYQIRGADGRDWAVKCFTRPVTGLGERYAAISDALVQAKLPFSVDFTYLAEGIRIGGAWWPVVKMEWVEGLLLNQVIRENASRPAILAAFGQMWGKLCRKLRDTKVAHADLQHGNVLMVPGSRPGAYGLKLIDYDGMHVPALTNQPSGESGHPAYQHPGRTGKHGYSPDMDRFPHLLIATALKALEVCGRPLWERYDTGDNLLFVEADIHDVANSVLMKELWQTQHPALQALVGRLAIAALRPMPQTPWLDQIAPEGEPLPLNEETRREAMQAFGLIPPLMVPLPPEPDAPPLHWGDIVEQPPALVVPTVLTGSGTAKALASKRKFAGVAEEEVPQPPDRGAAKGPPPKGSPAAKASSTRLLVLGLGALLVLGGGLALVLMNLGKPKPQVAEAESEEPAVPVSKPSKPKEANSTASTAKSDKPEVAKTNPIETLPDPIAAPEKIVTTPVPTDAPQVTIKERNRIALGETLTNFATFDQDGEHLVVLGLPPKLISYEPQTGKALPLAVFAKQAIKGTPHFAIVDEHVVAWTPGENFGAVADLSSGAVVGKVVFPDLPPGTNGMNEPMITISPDTRYIAAGRRSSVQTRPPGGGEATAVKSPFQLVDTSNGKQILSFDWITGSVHFTADATRVLVYENYGRARWFKLPSGELETEWKYGALNEASTTMTIEAASQDGQRLLCYGMTDGRQKTHFIMDGIKGRILFLLGANYFTGTGRVSANGRTAAILQRKATPLGEIDLVVFDIPRGSEVARIKVAEGSFPNPFLALAPSGRRAMAMALQQNSTAIVYDLVRPNEPTELVVKSKDTPAGTGKDAPPAFDVAQIKPRWTATVPALTGTRIYFDTTTNLLAVGGNEGGLALDVETGAIKKEFTALNNGKTHSLFPLEHDRFATVAARWDDFEIWDAKTGKVSERLTLPGLPAGPPNANTLQIALSQNKKYVAIGRVGTPALDYAELPFKVVEAATRKVLVPGDWHGGSAHFTTDSARVLVAEWTGRARWYKIPSGEPDGGWDFGPPRAGRINTVHGIAANGSLVAYSGPGVDKGTGETLGLLDGKTGRIIRTFKKEYLDSSPIALAENGQRVALLRAPQPASDEVTRSIDVIDVVSGAAFNRVQIDSGESPPTFHLTPDGKALVVHDAAARKVYFFETIAPKLK